MPRRFAALRGEVAAATLGAVAAEGPGFDRRGLMVRFAGRGASRRSLQRWVAGTVAGLLAPQVPAIRADARAAAAAATIADALPPRLPVDRGLGPRHCAAGCVETCLVVAFQLAEHGHRHGSPRRLRQAAQHLARVIDTAETMAAPAMSPGDVEHFRTVLTGVLAREAPAIAAAVLARLHRTGSHEASAERHQ